MNCDSYRFIAVLLLGAFRFTGGEITMTLKFEENKIAHIYEKISVSIDCSQHSIRALLKVIK